MNEKKILIAEDNTDVSNIMRNYLLRAGYTVYQAFDSVQAVDILRSSHPDLLLLDVMMPHQAGHRIGAFARSVAPIPVIAVTTSILDIQKMKDLEPGADDYLKKPFSFHEMLIRVDKLLHRCYDPSADSGTERRYGDLVLCTEKNEAKLAGKVLNLTNKEFKILDYLALHANVAIKKQKIMDEVWGFDDYIDENTLAVTVGRLRSKLAKVGIHPVTTVWGIGYKFTL